MTIRHPLLQSKQITLKLKRDDLLALQTPFGDQNFCGNKWRKLKYNLLEAKNQNHTTLLTFGGAFSNHIAAVASAGALFNLQTIGIIRGEETLPLNPTLHQATRCGMQLHYVSRSDYKHKTDPAFLEQLAQKFGDFYSIPEGGSNVLALKGCEELAEEVTAQCTSRLPDYYCLPCGTGGTIAGFIQGMKGKGQILGFSALKGDFMTEEVEKLLVQNSGNWQIVNDYHFGGFARFKPALIDFINSFKAQQNIQLDPLYTGKMLYGIFDLIEQDRFIAGTHILAIHTGGIQGLKGFNQRFGTILK
jgi:1-aminocyclopropane-1-carboxylate deaminase/D-cysteine desulfhydrase-like pyridoxal-dependent ACC family enzyme